MSELIATLEQQRDLPDDLLCSLLETDRYDAALFQAADRVRRQRYGTDVFVRGLIEFTNYCRNDCYYCGIRRSNAHVQRYRLTPEEILACCTEGYALGFRTFVLQGGEDAFFTEQRVCEMVSAIRERFPDCAITLSVGEWEKSSYRAFFRAGANRYLLRHETADAAHYRRLHPQPLSSENRKRCLFDLKDIGYQVGSGFMVGSPYQTTENLCADLRFLQELEPDMIGIGPYLTHKDTPFREQPNGSLAQTLRLIGILRLLFPYALIPATTALGTIHPQAIGRRCVSGQFGEKIRACFRIWRTRSDFYGNTAQSRQTLFVRCCLISSDIPPAHAAIPECTVLRHGWSVSWGWRSSRSPCVPPYTAAQKQCRRRSGRH